MNKFRHILCFITVSILFFNPLTGVAQVNNKIIEPKDFTCLEFLHRLKKNDNYKFSFLTIVDEFPANWISENQIDSLIHYVNSKEKAYCFVNPFSSTIPTDSAEIGGFAIKFISAFKQKQPIKFGLYSCPKADLQQAEKLTEWWSKNKNR